MNKALLIICMLQGLIKQNVIFSPPMFYQTINNHFLLFSSLKIQALNSNTAIKNTVINISENG